MKLLTLLLRQPATLLLTALLFVSSAHAATLVSSVNRNNISSSQTINLTVRYDAQASGSQLNVDALEKDFEVLSMKPQSSSSTSFVNGRVTKEESTVWSIILAAKREGELTIPAFEINGDKSIPITIQVQNGGANSADTEEDLSIFVSTDKQSVYESQQILLEVELSAAQGLSGFNGSKFDIQGAQINELGQRNEQRIDNGIVRNVFILSYAIFPERAGKLHIPPLSFTAVKGRQRGFFGDVGGEQVIARSTGFDVMVKPADKTHSPWFPADDVQVVSQWSGDTNSVIAGEPITRTVTIRALGQQASAIPPLTHPSENGYKSYKDQAQLDTRTTSQGYVSTRVESEAIVVSTPGTLTLPAISFKWWDVNKGSWQEAVAPEQTLTVLPSTNTNNQATSVPNTNAIPQTLNTQSVDNKVHWLWPIASAVLLLICLIQGYFLWVLNQRVRTKPNTEKKGRNNSESSTWSALSKSFKSNDASNIRQALGSWAQTLSSSQAYMSLNDLANYSDDAQLNKQLKKAITELETSLYKEQGTFDSALLKTHITALRHALRADTKVSDNKTLTPLYKN